MKGLYYNKVRCALTAALITVLLHNAIPFVGFGFLDNAIMIAAVSGINLCSGSVRFALHLGDFSQVILTKLREFIENAAFVIFSVCSILGSICYILYMLKII